MKRLLLMLIVVVFVLCGCSNTQIAEPESTPTIKPTVDPIAEQVAEKSLKKHEENPPEPYSNAMVDYMAMRARKNAKTITEDTEHAALSYISANILDTDLYDKQYTMETMMYFGFMLDYAYGPDDDKYIYAEIGWDTVKAIKYVYRGYETPEEAEFPRQQAIEGLIELGYLKPDVLE